MPLTIDLFYPHYSRYEVLHHFTKNLHQALFRLNPKCRLLKLDKHKPQLLLKALKDQPPDCTLTFNAMPPNDGVFFADMIKIPHLSCLVDSPATLFFLINGSIDILNNTRHSLFSFVDRDSSRVLKEIGFNQTFFFPHAIEKELDVGPIQEKPYDVLVLNSPIDFRKEEEDWRLKFSPEIRNALHKASSQVLENPKTSYLRAFAKEINLIHSDNTVSNEIVNFHKPLISLERHIRGIDRFQMINAIKTARIDLFGTSNEDKDWNRYFTDKPNLVVHPPISFKNALITMKHSKIVLNSISWINDGFHERLLSAMASQALVITTRTPFLEQNFIEGEELLFYDLNHWDHLNDLVNFYLANESKRKEIAQNGQIKVKKLHTWDNRAHELQSTLSDLLRKI